jgi:hypothetical protein
MKTRSTLLATFVVCMLSGTSFAQEEVKKEMRSIKKEVRIEEENGVQTVTITTDENGVKTEEVFTGEEAEKKMAEMAPEPPKLSTTKGMEQRVEVNVEQQANDKKVTITKTSNGTETVEVYEGEEAETKLKELESETGTQFSGEEKKIVVKKKEVRRKKKKDLMDMD